MADAKPAEPEKTPTKPAADWVAVEKDYRAGIRALRDIAASQAITEGAIRKRAKHDEWSRNLQPRIAAKAEEKVRKELVRTPGTQLTAITEKQVVEVNAEILAQADLVNRKDVLLALDVSRSQLEEVAALSDPQFRDKLIKLGEDNDKSYMTEAGREVADKNNELYMYIISLAGRVKMSKEIAASHGVYIPMQRKILKLDSEADKNQAEIDALLSRINASHD